MRKGWLFGKLSHGKEPQLKNTLMGMGSQGKFAHNLEAPK